RVRLRHVDLDVQACGWSGESGVMVGVGECAAGIWRGIVSAIRESSRAPTTAAATAATPATKSIRPDLIPLLRLRVLHRQRPAKHRQRDESRHRSDAPKHVEPPNRNVVIASCADGILVTSMPQAETLLLGVQWMSRAT